MYIISLVNLKQGKNVVCHCAQGKSRSGAIVVSYLMSFYSIPYEEALQRAQKARQMIQPNVHFEEQIKQKQKELVVLLKE